MAAMNDKARGLADLGARIGNRPSKAELLRLTRIQTAKLSVILAELTY
jgi:hypothetical protein